MSENQYYQLRRSRSDYLKFNKDKINMNRLSISILKKLPDNKQFRILQKYNNLNFLKFEKQILILEKEKELRHIEYIDSINKTITEINYKYGTTKKYVNTSYDCKKEGSIYIKINPQYIIRISDHHFPLKKINKWTKYLTCYIEEAR